MSKKQINKEKIIHSFLSSAAEKSPGATSLADIADILQIKKASLYNHFSSREEMYNATLDYCAIEVMNATFISRESVETAKNGKIKPTVLVKKIFTQYFKLFEGEPFFKMYVFIHSEQYFNRQAMEIVEKAHKRMIDDTKNLLKIFRDRQQLEIDEKDLKECANALVSLLNCQMDLYIAQRKEVIRQNPDTGAGSLFELPMDENLLNRSLKPVDFYLKAIGL